MPRNYELTPEQNRMLQETWLSLRAAKQLRDPKFVGPVRLTDLLPADRDKLGFSALASPCRTLKP